MSPSAKTMVKRVVQVIGCLLAALVLFCGGYYLTYAQGVIPSSAIDTPGASRQILIASQGSDYKQALVEKLAARLQQEVAAVKIIDVTVLPTVKETEWDNIVLISTIEFYAAQKDAAAFIAAARRPERIVLFTTSGQGDMPPRECRLAAITGASKAANLDEKVAAIMARLSLPAPAAAR